VAVEGVPEAVARVKSWPVPVRVTVCVLPATLLLLSVMVSVPVSVPAALGEKVTSMVQEPLAATRPPQVSVCEKSPLVAMLAMVSDPVPVLLSVTGCEALVVPAAWRPKVRLVGAALAMGKKVVAGNSYSQRSLR
jgi:hypothetical protein